MKVFICWSGSTSKRLAEIFRDWIPAVIQAIKPYFSPEDIEKGARWLPEISKELEESVAGIICLTRDNLEAPWIMFEAGALSKSVGRARIIPLLFGIEATDIKGPLLQFQTAPLNKEGVRKMLKTLNLSLGENALEQSVLNSVFEKWWPELESKILDLLKKEKPQDKIPLRNDRDILEEILTHVRSLHYRNPTLLLTPIDLLQISNHVKKCLKNNGILFIGNLIQMTENDLLNSPYELEMKDIYEVKELLLELGLQLGML